MRNFFCTLLVLLVAMTAAGQTISSTISGTVVDASGAVVPNVQVTLTENGTGATRSATTDTHGLFRFLDINAGNYNVAFQRGGFKERVEQNINLDSSEVRDLGKINLSVGSVTETVIITAQTTPVQTTTGEKSATITGDQLSTIEVRGRDLFAYMKLVPGVIDTNLTHDIGGNNAANGIIINGNTSAKNVSIDGITALDTGSNVSTYEPNLDAVQQVRILSAAY